MITTRQHAADIIALTYRYVSSYAVYLGVKLQIFSSDNTTFTVKALQQQLFAHQGQEFTLESLELILNTLCACHLIDKNVSGQYKLTQMGHELCDQQVQAGILSEFGEERWNFISRLSADEVSHSPQLLDQLFFQGNYTEQLSPELKQLIKGYQDVKMLQFACSLNLIEQRQQQLNEASQRILDYLLRLQILDRGADGYQLNEYSRLICGESGNFQSFILHETTEKWLALQQLFDCLQTNEVAFDKIYGVSLFDYLQSRPAMSRIFHEAMTAVSTTIEIPAIVEQIPFSGVVMDMGGGQGKLISAILVNNKDASGIIFDLPEVIESVDQIERCQLQAGSFFNLEEIPEADTIILKRVLHDWDDARAVTILQNCQAKLKQGGRIIIIEYLADSELMAKAELMLRAIGGKARTSQDFKRVVDQAGLSCQRIVSLTPMLSMIELQSLSLQNKATIFNASDSRSEALSAATTMQMK